MTIWIDKRNDCQEHNPSASSPALFLTPLFVILNLSRSEQGQKPFDSAEGILSTYLGEEGNVKQAKLTADKNAFELFW